MLGVAALQVMRHGMHHGHGMVPAAGQQPSHGTQQQAEGSTCQRNCAVPLGGKPVFKCRLGSQQQGDLVATDRQYTCGAARVAGGIGLATAVQQVVGGRGRVLLECEVNICIQRVVQRPNQVMEAKWPADPAHECILSLRRSVGGDGRGVHGHVQDGCRTCGQALWGVLHEAQAVAQGQFASVTRAVHGHAGNGVGGQVHTQNGGVGVGARLNVGCGRVPWALPRRAHLV